MSGDCYVALRGAWICLQFVTMVFPDHTHYLLALLGQIPEDVFSHFEAYIELTIG